MGNVTLRKADEIVGLIKIAGGAVLAVAAVLVMLWLTMGVIVWSLDFWGFQGLCGADLGVSKEDGNDD